MKIAIASDHRGYELKEFIKKSLKEYDFIDLGTNSSKSADYPDYGIKLGEYVNKNKCFGVAICGSGIGISIACNKVKGIRCAKVNSIKDAIITRRDNDSNVIAFSANMNKERVLKVIKAFVTESFTNEERHINRINKIKEYESNH